MLRLAIDVSGNRRCTGGACGTGGTGRIGSAGAGGSGRADKKFELRLRVSLCAFGGHFLKDDFRLVVEATELVVEGPPGSLVPTRMGSILGEFVRLLLCVRPFAPAGGAPWPGA